MCTVSIYSAVDQVIVTMNRDEARDRPELNTIKYCKGQHTDKYYPVDQKSLGTWFGFNNHGMVFALLNRYHEHHIDEALSRGTIIPTLLNQSNLEDCKQHLSTILQNPFNPFNLLCINKNRIIDFSWNGKTLKETQYLSPQTLMFSSSSIETERILKKRSAYFDKFKMQLGEQGNKPGYFLNHLHRQQDKDDKSSSIFMSRNDTHTKSISQIIINNQQLHYDYFDELYLNENKEKLNHAQCQYRKLELSS